MLLKTPATWILLRGLAREKRHWGDFLEQFRSAFPNDKILALDLPGAGEFFKETSPRTVEGMFNFVRGECDQPKFYTEV